MNSFAQDSTNSPGDGGRKFWITLYRFPRFRESPESENFLFLFRDSENLKTSEIRDFSYFIPRIREISFLLPRIRDLQLQRHIRSKLTFDPHVSDICTKVSQKLHALSRVGHLMSFKRRREIMHAFILSQFGYCPLVWMFHSRKLNNRINTLHERALRIVYQDRISSFDELLSKDGSFTIHERNIQTLAIELYKVWHGLSPKIMELVFPLIPIPDILERRPS